MIYFKPDLKNVALELIKTKDNIDLSNDINELSSNITALETYPTFENVLIAAHELDNKMQVKYPMIGMLLNAGNKLGNVFNMPSHQYSSKAECLIEYLKQDMYGILCHALIKGNVINSRTIYRLVSK